ncbi:MAG: cysteine--tRNA ligase [Sphaerimonospora mesophila]
MKLFNTRTHEIEDFKTLDDSQTVRVYSCGPTVYNHAHIGNLSAYVFADMLRRALRLAGYQINHVMNFTDVDDKTIRDSAIKYPDMAPEAALAKLTHHYETIFLDEMTEIGNDTAALTFVRATESIEGMKGLIRRLVEQGVAYLADDGIYFSIAEYQRTRRYGQLSHIELTNKTRSRIDNDEYDKDSAQDFALWKKQKSGEPAWDFDLTGLVSGSISADFRGRPGWHIECSVMSASKLGQPFDIHTGGIDLIFPHHENEIAQSTAGDQPELYANFFIHNEHLLVDGVKMAKSKHNFYTLVDIKNQGFDPLDFRMLILQSHYQSPSNFSWENLTAARNRRRNWHSKAELRWQIEDSHDDGQTEIVNNLLDKAKNALEDNLDTPNTLRYIDEAFDQFIYENVSHFALDNVLRFIDESLGLTIQSMTPDITAIEKGQIAQRQMAKQERDFDKSDRIRDALLVNGLQLNDLADRTIWNRL